MIAVDVQDLKKTYRVYRKREGLWASVKGLFRQAIIICGRLPLPG